MSFFSIIFIASLSVAAPKIAPFTNMDLSAIFKSNAKTADTGVIYSWSPHMSLSVKGLSEILDYGNRNKFHVVVVLDPDANLELAIQILNANKLPMEYARRNESSLLLMRGSRIHYPSYHFISKGRFSRSPLPGYKLYAELDEFRKGQKK